MSDHIPGVQTRPSPQHKPDVAPIVRLPVDQPGAGIENEGSRRRLERDALALAPYSSADSAALLPPNSSMPLACS